MCCPGLRTDPGTETKETGDLVELSLTNHLAASTVCFFRRRRRKINRTSKHEGFQNADVLNLNGKSKGRFLGSEARWRNKRVRTAVT